MKPPTKSQRTIMLAFVGLVAAIILIIITTFGRPAPEYTWSGTVLHAPWTVTIQDHNATPAVAEAIGIHISEAMLEMEARFSREPGMGLVADFNKIPGRSAYYFGAETWRVIDFHKRLHNVGGMADITMPLLEDLWAGVAAGAPRPTREDIQRILVDCGMERLLVPAEPYVRKMHPALQISLDTVAHGYIADRIAAYLASSDIDHYLILIDGIALAGNMRSAAAMPIRETGGTNGPTLARVNLQSGNMATVGPGDGLIHLDPETGAPLTNNILSVTVAASSGMAAKGLATCLYHLGPAAGLDWLATNAVATGEALFIVRGSNGTATHIKTAGFPFATP